MLTQNQVHIFLDSGKVLHPEEGVWSLIHLLSSINKFYISKILLELIFLVLLFPDILLFFLFVFHSSIFKTLKVVMVPLLIVRD